MQFYQFKFNCVMDCPPTLIVRNFNPELAGFKFKVHFLCPKTKILKDKNASTNKINVFWKILTWCN